MQMCAVCVGNGPWLISIKTAALRFASLALCSSRTASGIENYLEDTRKQADAEDLLAKIIINFHMLLNRCTDVYAYEIV